MSSQDKHTVGKIERETWTVEFDAVTAAIPGHIIKTDDDLARPVALVPAGTGSKGPEPQRQRARVMAASPELLEALNVIQSESGPLYAWANEKNIDRDEWRRRDQIVDKVRAAIQKATGEKGGKA